MVMMLYGGGKNESDVGGRWMQERRWDDDRLW